MADVGEINFLPGARAGMALPPRVYVFDETIREGEETPGVTMTVKDKVNIAVKLEEAGVWETNVGYVAYIPDHAEACKQVKKATSKLRLNGYIRAHGGGNLEKDLEFAKSLPMDQIDINIPCSEYQFQIKKINKEYTLERTHQAISTAKKMGFNITFGPFDTTRTDLDYLKKLLKVGVEAGANRVRVYDTLGILNPPATRFWIQEIKKAINVPIQYHCHDDFGCAVANTCAAVEGGAEIVDLVVNGLGDRAGNCSMEETVMALECLYRVNTGFKLEKLMDLSRLVEGITKIALPKNKPIVGANTFIHEADIHVAAILSGYSNTFEPYKPDLVGQKRQIYFGSTTSSDSVIALAESRKLKLDKSRLDDIMEKIKKEVNKKGYASDTEVEKFIKG
jgi:2-isopropylmalate synthase